MGKKKAGAPPRRDAKRGTAPNGPPQGPTPELLLEREVMARTRLSHAQLWRLEAAGRFPKRVKIGFRRIAWRAADIDAWISGDAADGSYGEPKEAA
jgi:prophage regulatory protein